MKKFLLITLALFTQHPVFAADNFSTVEERMTGKEFIETGLTKLSADELATLNEWLRRHSVATLKNVSAPAAGTTHTSVSETGFADQRGFENKQVVKDKKMDETIHSNIVGAFRGWKSKGTIFKLANGMIWKQSEKDKFGIKEVENPEVTIKKGFLGTWRLSVVGYHSSVRVKRIQ